MKTIFAIGNYRDTSGDLLIEVGQDHCCYAFVDHDNKYISYLKYFGFEELEADFRIAGMLAEFDQEVKRVAIASSFPQALLVPRQHSASAGNLLDLIYDQTVQKQFSDKISEWQMDTVYAFPLKIYEQLLSKFPDATFLHSYTASLRTPDQFDAEDKIELHITTQRFRVLVKSKGQVQLAQSYSYRSPLDLVYFLLKICYELEMDQSTVLIALSGLVEKDSAMYKELHNYFLNLHFSEQNDFALPESELPRHYFTSLYNLAACVS